MAKETPELTINERFQALLGTAPELEALRDGDDKPAKPEEQEPAPDPDPEVEEEAEAEPEVDDEGTPDDGDNRSSHRGY